MTPELWLFEARPGPARRAAEAGIDALVVDWEWRGKSTRQAGADTEINRDTVDDLAALREIDGVRRICRLNAWGPWSDAEVETALECGATTLLLPMVRGPDEVERLLRRIDGRAGGGILAETAEAMDAAPAIAALEPAAVYVGLNDLALSRGDSTIFEAVADGTVERAREAFAGLPFGFGGVTVADGGDPVPARLLLAEMARLACDFAILRRSWKRDVDGRDEAEEVTRLRRAWAEAAGRGPDRVARDRAALAEAIAGAAAPPE